jgi:hypothetical protein
VSTKAAEVDIFCRLLHEVYSRVAFGNMLKATFVNSLVTALAALRNIFRQKLVSVFLAGTSKINVKYLKNYGFRKFVNHVIIPKISTFFVANPAEGKKLG